MVQGMRITKVVLNVNDLEKMRGFYEEVVGLTVLHSTSSGLELGVKEDGVGLLTLQKGTHKSKEPTAGLYHTAFLLPSREDLSSFLKHMLERKGPVEGASYHGYSEAIYLSDPEGNGIEVYSDFPKEEWDVKPDGSIEGVTQAIDTEGLLGMSVPAQSKLPSGTTVGHIHLSVSDLHKSAAFYQDVLGFEKKYDFFHQAKFLASGFYHHHIALNTWEGTGLKKRNPGQMGLDRFVIELPDQKTADTIKANLAEHKVNFKEISEGKSITVSDPDGIVVKLTMK